MFENVGIVKEYMDMLKLDKSENTISLYSSAINRFFSYIGGIESLEDVESISSHRIREYQAYLKQSGLGASSVNSHGRALRAFFNWMYQNEYISENPFSKVKNMKEPKRELSYLTEDEIVAMFRGCKNIEEKTIISVLLVLGLRRSELTNLKVSDIKGDEIKIIGKGDKERTLYFPEGASLLVQEHIKTRKYGDCEYLFCKMGRKYSEEAIRLKIKSIAKRGGIDESRIAAITPHTMRRTFATNLVSAKVDIRVIQNAMGHASINTTLRYAKVRNSVLEDAMKNQGNII